MLRGHKLRHKSTKKYVRCPKYFVVRLFALIFAIFLATFHQATLLDTTMTPNKDTFVPLKGTRVRIHVNWHPTNRRDRFPTVEQRVKLYMGNWYVPKCPNTTNVETSFPYRMDSKASWPVLNVTLLNGESRIFNNTVMPDQWFVMDARVMKDCARQPWKHALVGKRESERVQNRRNMRPYCSDVLDLLDLMTRMDNQDTPQDVSTPVLGYFGDGTGYDLRLPFFAKFRPAATPNELAAVTADGACISNESSRQPLYTASHFTQFFKPILWKLESSRHFGPLESSLSQDTPWERKQSKAFWAGEMTGHVIVDGDSDLVTCQSNTRCRFVLQHAKSHLVDCWLTKQQSSLVLTSNVVNGTNLFSKPVTIQYIQQYKVIISLQGNDVASGLKWSLWSASVVLMPPPTQTSWAMEEWLQPWIHYIPMAQDGSNAQERVQWVLEHDEEARKIAERATLFMHDLVFHRDAARDDRQVKQEIVRRYRALWH